MIACTVVPWQSSHYITIHLWISFFARMKIHYYQQTYPLEIDISQGFTILTEQVSQILGKPTLSIVICNSANKRVTEDNWVELNADSELIVYDVGRAYSSGMNKEGRCTNQSCSYYNQMVVDNVGFPSTERIHHGCMFDCPFCGTQIEVLCVVFINCHFNVYTLSQDQVPKETNLIHASLTNPISYDLTIVDYTEQYDFNVQREDVYICRKCFKKIEHDHDCDRVHKRSLCGSCSLQSSHYAKYCLFFVRNKCLILLQND